MSMFGAGFVFGTIRMLFVVPALDVMDANSSKAELEAVLMEMPIMIAISWYLCRKVLVTMKEKKAVIIENEDAFVLSLAAFASLLATEVVFSFLAFGRTSQQVVDDFISTKGTIGIVGQALCCAFPIAQLGKKQTMDSRRRN